MSKEDKIIPLTNKADVKCERKTISEDILLWQTGLLMRYNKIIVSKPFLERSKIM